MRQQARQIQANPPLVKYANVVRDAFTNASSVIDLFQNQDHPDYDEEVTEVVEAAEAIKPEEPSRTKKEIKCILKKPAKPCLL